MTVVAMDPRFRARRITVARHVGRQRLRRVIYAAVAASLVALSWILTRSPLLDVDRVDVRGADHTSVQAIREAAGVNLGAQMFDLDPAQIVEAVSQLPWVEAVNVEREWPGTLRLQVKERTAIALVQHPSGSSAQPIWALLDGSGRVLAVTGEAMTQFPRIVAQVDVGEPGTDLSVEIRPALRVAERLPVTISSQLDHIRLVGGGGVVLEFAAGGSAQLGPISQLETKFLAILTMFESSPDMATRDIDVRAPLTPVLLADLVAEES